MWQGELSPILSWTFAKLSQQQLGIGPATFPAARFPNALSTLILHSLVLGSTVALWYWSHAAASSANASSHTCRCTAGHWTALCHMTVYAQIPFHCLAAGQLYALVWVTNRDVLQATETNVQREHVTGHWHWLLTYSSRLTHALVSFVSWQHSTLPNMSSNLQNAPVARLCLGTTNMVGWSTFHSAKAESKSQSKFYSKTRVSRHPEPWAKQVRWAHNC